MERLVLAKAMAVFDFWLLNSDHVRTLRGDWGEVMDIRFPNKEIVIYIDEKQTGFIKAYDAPEGQKTDEVIINPHNLDAVMKTLINKYKPQEY